MRNARVDANHKEVMQTFRRGGATVQSLAPVGAGCPDLIVGFRGKTMLIEVKDGSKKPSEQALTPAQEAWHAIWRGGPVHMVRSVDDALRVLAMMES